ncbi:MAG: hypothetical protein H0W24_09025, partial [Lysobacter sp.]|nr:hypothetical protein [Lysobacter sp.]
MAWTLTVGGTDITNRVRRGSIRIQQRAYRTSTTMSFDVEDANRSVTVNPEAEVILLENTTRQFAGNVRVRNRTHRGHTLSRVYDVTCQDFTALLSDDVIQSGARNVVETDKARISWLITTFGSKGVTAGTGVIQNVASMPAQDFSGMTLHEALTEVAKFSWARFYVDYNKDLKYTKTSVGTAPFNLSDTPNGSTTFGYQEFSIEEDTTDLVNSVLVIGEGVSLFREDATSITTYGRRRTVLEDREITTTTDANTRGDAFVAARAYPASEGSVVIDRAGVTAGMTIQITNSGLGISAQTFTISAMETTFSDIDPLPRYELTFGRTPRSLASTVGSAHEAAQAALRAIAATGEPVADLSIGGANLLPNSSFENAIATGWTVGANWVFSFGVTDAVSGTKVARVTESASASTTDQLTGPEVAVVATDDYWVSAWVYVRSRSAGTYLINLRCKNAAGTLLGTIAVGASFVAATTGWQRVSVRMGPNTAYGRTLWPTGTTKVDMQADVTGTATLTVDTDAWQIERGDLLSAYVPAPYELKDASITGALMADLSVTLAKLAVDSVDNSKL